MICHRAGESVQQPARQQHEPANVSSLFHEEGADKVPSDDVKLMRTTKCRWLLL